MRVSQAIWLVAVAVTLMSAARGATYEEEVLADNPFVYYRFNESEGNVAADSSGNGHDGVYVDVELGETSAGEGLGTAARFDGVSSLIEVPVLEFESDFLTIETWLNVDFIIGRCCTSVFSPTGWEPGWLHYNLGESARVEFALNSGGPNDRWTPDDALPLEDWTHVVSTYDAEEAEARIWIDGEEVEFDIPTFDTPQTVALIVEAQIGAWQNSRFLSGAIDEFAIYDTVLSEERILAHLNAAFGSSVEGDFDGDGARDVDDLDLLATAMMANDLAFDLTGDGTTDFDDRAFWVENLSNTYMGDANFDGEFNSSDFVTVFTAAKYETGQAATWAEGDSNGDNVFNSSDFVTSFQGQGYELGIRDGGLKVVPEPSGVLLILAGALGVIRRRRKF